jgi:hypothetical protein
MKSAFVLLARSAFGQGRGLQPGGSVSQQEPFAATAARVAVQPYIGQAPVQLEPDIAPRNDEGGTPLGIR